MDDLTITRLCAEAIGIHVEERANDLLYYTGDYELMLPYNPLHDNAQAMALVKKFKLKIGYGVRVKDEVAGPEEWRVSPNFSGPYTWHADLNAAICECVAKLKQGEGTS